MAKKFPQLLHIYREEADSGSFLTVSESGVFGVAEAGESIPCAIYKLVETGVVVSPPKFVSSKRKAT